MLSFYLLGSYGKIASRLTDWENHRTQTEWERLLITKTFLFRFLNSYISFFYIAFAKFILEGDELAKCVDYQPNSPGYKPADHFVPGKPECYLGCGTIYKPMRCMDELSTQIQMIFITQIVAGNFSEILVPIITRHVKLKRERSAYAKMVGRKVTQSDLDARYEQPETEAKYSEYRIEKEAFNDYAEMVVQFGFVTLFVVAYPLTPVLALLNNALEMHVDAVKLCFGFRRPFPQVAESIGQWAVFMNLQSSISVVTNIAVRARLMRPGAMLLLLRYCCVSSTSLVMLMLPSQSCSCSRALDHYLHDNAVQRLVTVVKVVSLRDGGAWVARG